jgi:tetratricopeptide (TPR) repeat protein
VGSPRIERTILPPIACALLAILLRLWTPGSPGAAHPWLAGGFALQGISEPGAGGPARTDLVISLPLVVWQNVAYAAASVTGSADGLSAAAWIHAHPAVGGAFLRWFWLAAAAGAAFLAARAARGWWGALAGVLVAIAPVGLVGTQRLEGWALASFFLLIALGPVRRSIGVLCWGIALSLSPLAWIAAAAGLAAGPRDRRLQVLLSLPLWFALAPARLLAPGAAVAEIPRQIAAAGWPGWRDGPFGHALAASWTPGVVILALGLAAWLRVRRMPERLAALLSVAGLWIVPALIGARRPEGIGLIAPVAILIGVLGAEEASARARRGRAWIAGVLAVGLLAPSLIGATGTARALTGRRDRSREAAQLIADEVGSSGSLVRDPAAPAPPDSIACFTLPKNVEQADSWDFAWWPGWYGDFTHLLISAGAVEAIENDPVGRPIGRGLLAALTNHAELVGRVGDPITERSAVLLFRIRPGPPWEVPNHTVAWKSTPAPPDAARFVGELASFLAGRGRTGSAIDLFRLALKWDDANPRLWNNLGASLLLMNEPKEAAEAFTEGLKRDPESVELRYGLARAYLQGNIPGRAEIELRQVLAARPNFAGAHYEMARIAAANENWAEAALALENYLAYEPDPPDRTAVEAALAEARRRAAVVRR